MTDAEIVTDLCNRISLFLNSGIKPNKWGFALVAFRFDDRVINYAANLNKRDTLVMLHELMTIIEAGEYTPIKGGLDS